MNKGKKVKASISILLAIITLSVFVFNSLFVDAIRLKTAKTCLNSATNLACNSTLANYDTVLKNRYGLFTLKETNESYIMNDFYSILIENLFGKSSSKSFDLYDFVVEDNGFKLSASYPLTDTNTLKRQISEFSKYRAALVQPNAFDMNYFSEQAQVTKKDISNLKSSIEIRKKVHEITTTFYELYQRLISLTEEVNCLDDDYQSLQHNLNDYINLNTTYSAVNDEIYICEKELSKLNSELSELSDQNSENTEEQKKLENDIKELEDCIAYLEDESSNIYDEIKKLSYVIKDTDDFCKTLSSYITELNELSKKYSLIPTELDNTCLSISSYKETLESGSKEVTDNIFADCDRYLSQLNAIKETYLDIWLSSSIQYIENQKIHIYLAYNSSSFLVIEKLELKLPYVEFVNTPDESKEIAKKLKDYYLANKNNYTNSFNSDIAISTQQQKLLPSYSYENASSLFNSIDINSLSDLESIYNSFDIMEYFLDCLCSLSQDILCDVYSLSMFRSRLTKPVEVWAESYNKKEFSDTDIFYLKRDLQYEKNLFLQDKNLYSVQNNNNFFNSEIEYIIEGNAAESENVNSVYEKIYIFRLINNLIALYSNESVYSLCVAASTLLAEFTLGVTAPLSPVIEFVILMCLSFTETNYDMYFLIDMGYQIPFIKTSSNVILCPDNLLMIIDGLLSKENLVPITNNVTPLVSYENYLLIFLLLTDNDLKLLRIADLIQLNMCLEKKDNTYLLSEHNTYISYNTTVTIKPLFTSYMFMPVGLRQDGRFKINASNYISY